MADNDNGVSHPAHIASNPDREAARRAKRVVTKRSTHKARSDVFRQKAAWPLRDVAAEVLARERRRANKTLAVQPAISNWESIGPTNVGGRMTCIVSHPHNADKIWAGAAGGGVWRSLNAGKDWKPLWHRQETLNVGSLAIDPSDPDVLYCGTGEANLSADSYAGVGVYKKPKRSNRWRLIARASKTGLPSRIGAIAVDPFDSQHLVLGGVGHRYPNESREPSKGLGGAYTSYDGGTNWERFDFISKNEYRCHSVLFHPTASGTFYITVTEQGMRNGIWRTVNGGKSWTQLTKGLPDPSLFERTSLAISPSHPSVLYALASDINNWVLGVFRTEDGGDSWNAVHDRPSGDPDTQGWAFNYKRNDDEYEDQISYNNTIVVHPQNPDHVICGGVDLHLTANGGQSWHIVTRWERKPPDTGYAHADHHALLMPTAKPDRVYAMNDGGMDVSENGGRTWTNRSAGLVTTMYYDLDVAQSDGKRIGGGAHDNGTLMTVAGKAGEFRDTTGADGGWVVFDPTDADHFYTSIFNMMIYRAPPFDPQTARSEEISPPADSAEKKSVWMCNMAMHPQDSKIVYAGSWRLWRTEDDGKKWSTVSPYFDDEITAIEIARENPDRIYVGTNSGGIYRSTNGGKTWSGNISGADLPKYKISRLKTSPDNADHVIVAITNFRTPHVFRSLKGGEDWQDVSGDLPDVPYNAIAIPWNRGREVYVGTDAGVFVSENFGDTWRNFTGDLPNVDVVDLVYHNADDTLTAATYGRGLWRIKVR